ncbi:MAG: T9SS type A sorting domain-containing protein [Saprospiraceae bacterium]
MNLLLRFLFMITLLIGVQLDAFAQFPPENDACFNAFTVSGSDPVSFTTLNADTDGPEQLNDCLSIGQTPSLIGADVWYKFTPDFSGQAIFSTCSTADFDTKIAVYAPGSACPPSADDLVGCNEDGTGCDNSTSAAIFDVEEGMTYILRLGGFVNGDDVSSGEGTFFVAEYIAPPGPPNDDCENAVEVMLDADEEAVYEFTTINSNTSGPFYENEFSCFDVGNNEFATYNDVWFKWTATYTGGMEFSNCGTANFDSRITAYGPNATTCLPDPFTVVGCSDDGLNQNGVNCGNFTSRTIFNVIEGGNYLFNVGAFSSSGSGMGTVLFKRTEPIEPPANNACADAVEVAVITVDEALNFDVIYEGTNFNATATVPKPACRPAGEFQDVFYKFNSGNNTELGLVFNIVTEGANFVIDITEACGTAADTLGPNFCYRTDSQDGIQYQTDTISGLPGVPTEYILRVSTRITSDAPGDFWFQLVGDPLDTSVDDLELNNFKFYPNPTTDRANAQFELAEATTAQVDIVNTLGQVVQSQNHGRLSAGFHNLSASVADLAAGVYFFRLQMAEGQKTIRFIKK